MRLQAANEALQSIGHAGKNDRPSLIPVRMQQSYSRRAVGVGVIAGSGLGLALVIESIHRRLNADLSYASFCNVSRSVNCDVVLTSPYAYLLGVSVAMWAAIHYALLLVAAAVLARSVSAARREALANVIFAGAVIGFVFSFYLAIVSMAVLGTVCLLCSGLYVVAVGMLVAAWMLRSDAQRVRARSPVEQVRQQRWLWAAGGLPIAVLAVAIGLQLVRSAPLLSAEEIAAQRPDFYRWYFSRPVVDVPLDGGNARGVEGAPITIIEFSDFGCGHCAAFDRNIGELLRGNDEVRLVFRHFPLDSACNPAVPGAPIGSRCRAAVAAECAGEQGKFWEYGRALFDHQPHFGEADLRRYAGDVRLDLAAFEACLKGEEARARVERDATAGAALGIQSTPTVFINGRRVEGDLGPDLVTALVLARSSR